MSQRFRVAVLFGPPGSGKGTQGKLLGCIPGFYHFATGDMFRSLDTSTQLGSDVAGYAARGELVPDDLTLRLFREHLNALRTVGCYRPDRDLMLLDGLPRTVEQARMLDGAVEVVQVVSLVCSDPQEMIRRIKHRAQVQCRCDDTDESVIRHRMNVYENETRPVLEHYPADRVARVDAIGRVPTIASQILNVLAPLLERLFDDSAM